MSSVSVLKFYTNDLCPFCNRVAIALYEVLGKNPTKNYINGVEKVVIDLKDKPEWYLKINPSGKVPSLQLADGRIFVESGIVTEYILEKYGNHDPSVIEYPTQDFEKKAEMKIFITKFEDTVRNSFYGLLRARGDEQISDAKKKLMKELLDFQEKLHPSGPFAFGERFSFADAMTIPWFIRFSALKNYREFDIPQDLTRLHAWINACLQRASVQDTKPDLELVIEGFKAMATA